MTDRWRLHPDYRTPRVPPGREVAPGPWRHPDDGEVMNGTYERACPARRTEVVTVWFGHALSRWIGPAMPRFSSPLVSAWNPVLAQGLRPATDTPVPYRGEHWCDRWIADALLYGRKPYGVFLLPEQEAVRWFGKSSGLVYRAERVGRAMIRVVAGSVEPFGDLFDLDALIADYRQALPEELAEEQTRALEAHRTDSPALRYVLGDVEDAAPAVRSLTLGYPPGETAARLLE